MRIGEQRWLLARATVDDADDAASEQRGRRQRELCWALPLDANGRPAPLDDDVLHAPTATTERVGLPARLIADLPLDPDRRHVRSGPGTDRVLQAAAGTYPGLVAALAPDDRLALVPAAGFPRSEVDGQLRALLLDVLRTTAWLPAAAGGDLAPARATWVDLPAADDLPALLADVVPRPGGAARRTAARIGRAPARCRRPGRPPSRRRPALVLVAGALRGAGTGRRHGARPARRARRAARPADRRPRRRRSGPGTAPRRRGLACRCTRAARPARRRARRGAPTARPPRCRPRRAACAAGPPRAARGGRPVDRRRRGWAGPGSARGGGSRAGRGGGLDRRGRPAAGSPGSP